MVGGLAIAWALEKADPDPSMDVLAAAEEELERLDFAPRGEPKFGSLPRRLLAKAGDLCHLIQLDKAVRAGVPLRC
jgi:hypothetical protein